MLSRCLVALTATALAVGCGSTGDDIVIDPGSTLVVSPSQAQLEVLNGTPASQPFTVMLVEPGGVGRDVTADVDWTISDPAFGTWSGPTFTASGLRAGKGMVHASLQTLVGEAQVEITIRGVRVAADVPSGAPGLFAGATVDPAAAPQIVYPSDQVIVPANLGDLEAHWTDAFGHDLFELTLAGDHVEQRVYVRGGAASWAAFTPAEWESAARSTEQLSIVVRGLTEATPSTVGTSPGIRVFHAREDLQGGLYYWAATAAAGQPYGIFRYDFGAVGQPAEEFYTTTQAGQCVACHVLSRDGTRMAITYQGGDGPASIVDVATRTPSSGATAWNFATYSPDGARLITSSQGVLTERSGVDGSPIAGVPVAGYATHPDFSPLGDALAYTQVAGPNQDWHFTGGTITVLPFTGGTWGPPRPLVTDGGNNFYPSFSPDGQWVLFNRSSEDAYDDASAELWVVRADGSAAPRKLDLANVAGGLTNSWARWAPFRNTFQGPGPVAEDMYWITFSSKRAFGVRQPPGKPQIWMAAFFPGRVAVGGDPTGPAFRLPFQDLGSNNHIAQWTETVVPIGKMAMPARADRAQR